ncbi:MAG: hypothetical protein OEY52_08815 [Gammaproteobacteria bacterium]|nr:hypothetical protein [Gammaproteobacteria bacterium]
MTLNNPLQNLLLNWYADPPSSEEITALCRIAIQRQEKFGQLAKSSFLSVMMQMIADWWLDESCTSFPNRGMHYATSRRKQALYHLIAGQLLMSCKMQSAMDYLDIGLRYADGIISSDNYFILYNRHEELRFLHLATERQKPYRLTELLNESRVMRKLDPRSGYSLPRKK